MSTPVNAPATVLQQSSSHAPVLSSGRVTIAAIRVFENACRRYFQHKKIEEENRVPSILYNFESSAIQSWINANQERLATMNFVEFLLEFKKKFLPRTWQDTLVSTQIALQGSVSFLTWSESVREANAELNIAKSDYYIPDNKLRNHFVPRLSTTLKASYDAHNTHGDLDKIANLDEWIECVHLLDTEIENKRKEWLKVIVDKGKTTTAKDSRTMGASTSVNIPNATSFIPKLTQAERELLKAHEGCFRCRVFYSGHISRDCPLGADGRPTPEACKTVNLATALKAKAAHTSSASGSHPSTVIAAVFDNDSEDNTMFEDEDLDKYVPKILSFPDHLWWDCCVSAPATCAPTPFRALIDHGCPPVLISSDMADLLLLQRKRLYKPFSVSGAFVKEKNRDMDSSPVLTEYCKLHLQSVDSTWKSRVINALVCPNLYTDIILGLDFLTKNKIIVDAELRTAVAKDSQYDLLNPPTTVPKPVILSPFRKRKLESQFIKDVNHKLKTTHQKVYMELNEFIKENPVRFDFQDFTMRPINPIFAIKTRITQLSQGEILRTLDSKFKKKFAEQFPPDIPHTQDLPHDVYHNIETRPGQPISVGRSYSCPRKYRDSWKTLIDQHYAAGRIRPSNSPYASPSFIIPKADKTALPRWVNDYRKLNKVTVPDSYPLPRIDDILADCSKGKIWGKIDMTNSFFQTRVNPEHIKYTATLTPFGLWEWLVMPMGLCDALATHQ
jgi:hypothetical protein